MVLSLNADKALIFRVTHINNVPWILGNGLHCKNSKNNDPNFEQIGDPDLIDKRATRNVPIPPGGTLSDYISFYFTPFSMMMYNIHTGHRGIRQFPNSEIVIMVSSLRDLADLNVTAVYTDRHAYLSSTQFYSSLGNLGNIDWEILQRRDFSRDLDDPEKTERYQAEALVHRHLAVEQLKEIVCYGANERRILQEHVRKFRKEVKIRVCPSWYF